MPTARARFTASPTSHDLGRAVLSGPDRDERRCGPDFALLQYLVETPVAWLAATRSCRRFWPGVFVTDDSISQCMREVRRALGDDGQQWLRTMPRRGYLMHVPVSRVDPGLLLAAINGISSSAAAEDADDTDLPRPATGRPIVLVVPFENIGDNDEQRYFVDETYRGPRHRPLAIPNAAYREPAAAGRLDGRSLPVTPWLSAEPAPRAAQFLVNGSVRRSTARIRVTAQLEDAESGLILWSGRFDRSLDDLFAVQEELADASPGCWFPMSAMSRCAAPSVVRRRASTPMISACAAATCTAGRRGTAHWLRANCSTVRSRSTPNMRRPMPTRPTRCSAPSPMAGANRTGRRRSTSR